METRAATLLSVPLCLSYGGLVLVSHLYAVISRFCVLDQYLSYFFLSVIFNRFVCQIYYANFSRFKLILIKSYVIDLYNGLEISEIFSPIRVFDGIQ